MNGSATQSRSRSGSNGCDKWGVESPVQAPKRRPIKSSGPPDLIGKDALEEISNADLLRQRMKTDPKLLGDNTPGRRPSRSPVWEWMKRLREGHPGLKMGGKIEYTHQCQFVVGLDANKNELRCNRLVKCSSSYDKYGDYDEETKTVIKSEKRKWCTTKLIDHFEQYHPNHSIAFRRKQRKSTKGTKRITALATGSFGACSPRVDVSRARVDVAPLQVIKPEAGTGTGNTKPSPTHNPFPTTDVGGNQNRSSHTDQVLSAQAKSYIYCKGRQSKSQLDDVWFQRSLKKTASLDSAHMANVLGELGFPVDKTFMRLVEAGYHSKAAPTLKGQAVKKWVESEFELFRMFLQLVVNACQVECFGNQIGQAIHDCGTLADKHKVMALGLQIIMPGWDRNMAVALSVRRMESGKDVYQAKVIEQEILRRTGYTFEEIAGSSIQDGAALGVAKELGVEAITCLMHCNDKVGASAVGLLVRTRNRVELNAFPEGQF